MPAMFERAKRVDVLHDAIPVNSHYKTVPGKDIF
jgi:hypothetical protein